MKLATVYKAIDRIASGVVVDSEETEHLEFKQDPSPARSSKTSQRRSSSSKL